MIPAMLNSGYTGGMKINGETQLLAVIGNPIAHSASPVMHNAVISDLGINFVYVPLFVESDGDLAAVFGTIRASNFMGLNVTIPYKEKVIPFMDKLSPRAEAMQAVNTIVKEGGQLIGHNTDGDGFLDALKIDATFDVSNKAVALIGAGGSAKAISFAVLSAGAKRLTILNRTSQRAVALQEQIKAALPSADVQVSDLGDFDVLAHSDLIVNTTSVGMAPKSDELPISDLSWVSAKHFCCDIIYKPEMTLFLKQSKKAGAKILGGIGMLAGQGARALELFIGQKVNYKLMRSALENER